jgi:hypothetical protein
MPNTGPPNHSQVVSREVSAWRLRCQGWTLQRIADHLGLSASGVWRILQRIEKRELKALSEHFAGIKVQVSNQLDFIIEQCADSWMKSKEPRKRASQKTTDADVEPATVTSTDVVEQCGDVSYLKTWMEAASMKMSLFGLAVAPADNEVSFTIADLVKDMEAKGKAYEEEVAREDREAAA